jgi:hypothetical protein
LGVLLKSELHKTPLYDVHFSSFLIAKKIKKTGKNLNVYFINGIFAMLN